MLSKVFFMPLFAVCVVAVKDGDQGILPWETIEQHGSNFETIQVGAYDSPDACDTGYDQHDANCCKGWPVDHASGTWNRRFCWERKRLDEHDPCVVDEQCQFDKDNHGSKWKCARGHVCGGCHSDYNLPTLGECQKS